VLAVDKTGTLTENKMQLAVLESIDSQLDLRQLQTQQLLVEEPSLNELLATALAASEHDGFDPMERAIHAAASQFIPMRVEQLASQQLIREFDLTPELLAVTHVWRSESSIARVTCKGAPETIFELCKLSPLQTQSLMARVNEHTRDGLRVLAVAKGTHAVDALPNSPQGFQLQFIGLICFADPLRDAVPAALAECYSAGIRVVMITGDHAGTALAIAKQAGFAIESGVLTGVDIDTLDDTQLCQRIRSVNIYARTKPQHKLRLVQAFKANGEVIAMTGDGVNDAPALKAAHIGVAMGKRGTDVAREAASLILVNDDFASLVAAVRLGRRIYDNIRHAMSFILAVHIPIAGLGLVPVLLGWPLMFLPMHVLFLEFIIDPACALVFESDQGATDLMQRKPRAPKSPLFSAAMVKRAVVLGSAVLVVELLIYGIALTWLDETQARTLAFISLVTANLALIFVSRSHSSNLATIYAKPNRIYWWIVALTLAALMLTVTVSAIASLFAFAAPSIMAAITVAAIACGVVLLSGRALNQS
jgi:P-type Ca2+ transporter type 2C